MLLAIHIIAVPLLMKLLALGELGKLIKLMAKTKIYDRSPAW